MSRKPPEPADSHAVIGDWIDEAMPKLRPIVEHVDKLIREAKAPELKKWNKQAAGAPGWKT